MSNRTEVNAGGKSENKPQMVWPTLFIGVGGTGMEISLRIRRRILNYIWGNRENPVQLINLSDFPLAQFINFDLNSGATTETGKAAETDPLSELVKFTEEEKLIFKLDMDLYMRTDGELNRYEHIASWFPLTRKKILELGIDPSKGAGQIRSLSRLYFFDKYLALKSIIAEKVRMLLAGVSNREKTERLGLELEPASLRVVVIASAAGGTGSGSFIDMGYLAKFLSQKQLVGAKVDLALMLPSGFSGHGKSRTEANAYAALMELEACIGHGLQFVDRWAKDEFIEPIGKPFDEVFLFDTGNLALKKTQAATDLFDMAADIFFEDFTSAEFANIKRSIAPNQSQYKSDSLSIPVDVQKYGNMKLMYSKAYSSFGQSIIDTQLEQKREAIACSQVNDMLRAFFGIASDDTDGYKVPPPTPDEGRKLLVEHAYCGEDNFNLTYKFIGNADPYKNGIEFRKARLIDKLLCDDEKSMISRLHDKVDQEIGKILQETEKDQRMPRLDSFRNELDRNLGIEGDATDPSAGGYEQSVIARRKMLFEEIVSEKSGLLEALWAAVDNKEKGGLDYTLQLIGQIQDGIENVTSGELKKMDNTKEWFAGLRKKIRDGELQILRERYNQTRGKGLFGSKDAHAEAILQQMGESIRWYAEARIREVASREAIDFLRGLSVWLGEHKGLDEKTGRKRWAEGSFSGKLAGYERLIKEIMFDMTRQVKLTQNATKQEHASYQVVKVSDAELDAARKLSPEKAMAWAKTIFDNLGGSRKIFKAIENDESRAELIQKLRSLALNKLPALALGENNPLIKALNEMAEAERSALFKHCIEMAIPWVEANPEGVWSVDPDQYACVIGISGADIFKKNFGDEFTRLLPARTRMTPNKIEFYETGASGKLTCYVEISGVPLPALTLLSTWRESYNSENKKIPVHTCKDKTLFVHPIAPSAAALDRLAEHFKLYLQGIISGAVKLIYGSEERIYCLTISGEELPIGNERAIRMEGLSSQLLALLQKENAKFFDKIKTPAQYAGLVALYQFYAQRVYPPMIIKDENHQGDFVNGFCNVMCKSLEKDARDKLIKKANVAGVDPATLIESLKGNSDNDRWEDFGKIQKWTDELDGSEADVYQKEVASSNLAKRILKKEFFDEKWIEDHFGTKKQSSTIVDQPPPVFVPYKVAIDGNSSGPFNWSQMEELVAKGQLMEATKVWRKPMKDWQIAGELEELKLLFEGNEPPLIDDDEPLLN